MPQQKPVDDWQNIDDWEDVSAPIAQEPNWFDTASSYIPQPVKSTWNWLWNPITDLPSRAVRKVSEPIRQFGESRPQGAFGTEFITGTLPKYAATGLEFVGDVLSGLSSPGNLALAATTGGASLAGKTALTKALPVVAPRVAQGLTNVGRAIGAGTAAHGAQTIVDPESSMFERGLGAIEAVGGGLSVRAPRPRARPIPTSGQSDLIDLPLNRPTPIETPTTSVTGEMLPSAQAGVFDPTTLKGLEPAAPVSVVEVRRAPNVEAPAKPELQFVDPKTGEIKSAAEAIPGDIPLFGQAPKMPVRAGARMGAPKLGLPKTEVIGQTTPQAPPSVASDASRLPKELQGAKPRFNIGANSYFLQFADDLDKALYIIAQKKPSRLDAEYLKFVMEQTGLDEIAARNLGNQVKSVIKQAVAGKETGSINIPPVARASKQLTGGVSPPIKPPVKPPVATGGEPPIPPSQPSKTPKEFLEGQPQISTGPLVPENASVITRSLSQRLQKAVDEAGTPNAVAAEDISRLLDETTETLNKLPEGPEKQGIIRQALGANKALLTSWDLSAPGRQGKALIFNKAWWTSLDDMVRAWGSKAAADNINTSIMEHPSGYFRKPVSDTGKVGKSFAESVGLDITSTEEMFRSTLGHGFEKYSLVGKSSRAHTAFLNKLRSDQFVSMMNDAKAAGINPETNTNIAKAYAKFINDATGRGSLNIGRWKLERNIGVLNDVFFAPKNMSGQIRTWNNVLNPVKYYNYDPVLRKQALRSLFAIAGMGLGVGEMARMAGAKVSNEITSSDFRKIKIGDTRIDPFGGYQQFPVAAMKFILGQSTPTTGEQAGRPQSLIAGRFGRPTRQTVAERFFTNRLSPAASFIWAWMNNREFDGKPFEVKRALFERTFPIAAKDLLELAQEDPAIAAILTPTTIMGLTGTQTYTGR